MAIKGEIHVVAKKKSHKLASKYIGELVVDRYASVLCPNPAKSATLSSLACYDRPTYAPGGQGAYVGQS